MSRRDKMSVIIYNKGTTCAVGTEVVIKCNCLIWFRTYGTAHEYLVLVLPTFNAYGTCKKNLSGTPVLRPGLMKGRLEGTENCNSSL